MCLHITHTHTTTTIAEDEVMFINYTYKVTFRVHCATHHIIISTSTTVAAKMAIIGATGHNSYKHQLFVLLFSLFISIFAICSWCRWVSAGRCKRHQHIVGREKNGQSSGGMECGMNADSLCVCVCVVSGGSGGSGVFYLVTVSNAPRQ